MIYKLTRLTTTKNNYLEMTSHHIATGRLKIIKRKKFSLPERGSQFSKSLRLTDDTLAMLESNISIVQ